MLESSVCASEFRSKFVDDIIYAWSDDDEVIVPAVTFAATGNIVLC